MQILLEKYPKGDKLLEVYDTEEDAAGLYIPGPITMQSSHPFRHPFVYQVNPEGGDFEINDELNILIRFYFRQAKVLSKAF